MFIAGEYRQIFLMELL